jgi:endonuclease-3 related protein
MRKITAVVEQKKSQTQAIQKTFLLLFNKFGPQHWWPGETPFEIMAGAVLTQQTAWKNVEKAIENLKKENLLSPEKIANIDTEKLAGIIRPAGFYNVKAKRLKTFVNYFVEKYNSDIQLMRKRPLFELRKELLSVNGIGEETADSILLYALEKEVFVVDAYTKRIYNRLGIVNTKDYKTLQAVFEKALTDKKFVAYVKENIKPAEKNPVVYIFKEMHALIVAEGKFYCKTKPLCGECPLKEICKRKEVK